MPDVSAPVCSETVSCPLCASAGGEVVWQGARWRLVHAEEKGFPGFYRLIWNRHVEEWSDLDHTERMEAMEALTQIEKAMREHLQPCKMNLATLGNVVPHLHWHAIARFEWDSHFPRSVWADPLRELAPEQLAEVERRRGALERHLAVILETLDPLATGALQR